MFFFVFFFLGLVVSTRKISVKLEIFLNLRGETKKCLKPPHSFSWNVFFGIFFKASACEVCGRMMLYLKKWPEPMSLKTSFGWQWLTFVYNHFYGQHLNHELIYHECNANLIGKQSSNWNFTASFGPSAIQWRFLMVEANTGTTVLSMKKRHSFNTFCHLHTFWCKGWLVGKDSKSHLKQGV